MPKKGYSMYEILEYLTAGVSGKIFLQRGSVDNLGASRYCLQQNEPDSFVYGLQTILIMMEYWVGLPDGVFGTVTKELVQEFQKVNSLTTDGIVGQNTFKKLLEKFKIYDKKPKMFNQCKILPVPFFSQGDPKWGKKILGKNKNIQQAGCLITCLSMLGSYLLNKKIDPGMVDTHIDSAKGYIGDSVIWNKTMPFLGCKYKGKTVFNHDTVKNHIEKNKPVITRVDYGIDGDLRYNHFVLIIGIIPGDYIVHDPATRVGNGIAYINSNVLSGITRKGGYNPIFIDNYEVT